MKKNLTQQIEKESLPSSEVEKADILSKKLTKTKTKSYSMDLKIHSPASLSYLGNEGIETAPALVRLAKNKGLDMIAITDFYSGTYVDKVVQAAKDTSLVVIPGVDIRCQIGACNDVCISCLFPEGYDAQKIEALMHELKVPKAAYGSELYLVDLPFKVILSKIEAFGGIALPSRMDKTPYRMEVIKTLVEDYGFRVFDLVYEDSKAYFKKNWPKVKFHLFSFSNANALAQIGSRIETVKLEKAGFEGIKTLATRKDEIQVEKLNKPSSVRAK